MIVAKTKLDNEIFNIIIYAIKNNTKVIIPKTIKSILFYASNDSTLETIGNYAFCKFLLNSLQSHQMLQQLENVYFIIANNLNLSTYQDNK